MIDWTGQFLIFRPVGPMIALIPKAGKLIRPPLPRYLYHRFWRDFHPPEHIEGRLPKPGNLSEETHFDLVNRLAAPDTRIHPPGDLSGRW